LSHQTGNKEFGHLARMFDEINTKHRLRMAKLFAGKRFSGDAQEPRPPFDPEYVQETLLGHRVMADLNSEARRILFVMADTGMRPSEVCNLSRARIVLDAEIPHVQVRPDEREIKTRQSSRDIPLVGTALAAMKMQPDGFPRYRDKGGSLSATVNAFLRNNKLLPTPKHTAYSLRHTFKDRLVAVEAPDSIVDQLMGHREDKPVYGKGASLTIKLKWLQAIAFRPPSRV
jgi:integrase